MSKRKIKKCQKFGRPKRKVFGATGKCQKSRWEHRKGNGKNLGRKGRGRRMGREMRGRRKGFSIEW